MPVAHSGFGAERSPSARPTQAVMSKNSQRKCGAQDGSGTYMEANGMSGKSLALAGHLALALLVGCGESDASAQTQSESAASVPLASVERLDGAHAHEFGTVAQGTQIGRVFDLVCMQERITIRGVLPSCACAVSSVEIKRDGHVQPTQPNAAFELVAGDHMLLSASLDTAKKSGPVRELLRVVTVDEEIVAELAISGTVTPTLECDTPQIPLGVVALGASSSAVCTVRSRVLSEFALEVNYDKKYHDWLTVGVATPVSEQGNAWTLSIEMTPRSARERSIAIPITLTARPLLPTSEPQDGRSIGVGETRLLVTAEIVDRIYADRAYIALGLIDSSRVQEAEFTLMTTAPMDLVTATVSDLRYVTLPGSVVAPSVTFEELERTPISVRFKATLQFQGTASKGAFRGRISVPTERGESTELEIPIFGLLGSKEAPNDVGKSK
jgi:hypothetical protein